MIVIRYSHTLFLVERRGSSFVNKDRRVYNITQFNTHSKAENHSSMSISLLSLSFLPEVHLYHQLTNQQHLKMKEQVMLTLQPQHLRRWLMFCESLRQAVQDFCPQMVAVDLAETQQHCYTEST